MVLPTPTTMILSPAAVCESIRSLTLASATSVAPSIFDVIVDIRRGSPTFGRYYSVVLAADDHRGLYIPAGFAHGFQTLAPHATVLYLISAPYDPALAGGIASNDPSLAIDWPGEPTELSQRDRDLPRLADANV